MESNENTPAEIPAMTPPSEVGELPAKPSGWPTAIGAISIIFGSLGVLCYGCGAGWTMMTPMLVGGMPADQRPPTPQGVQLFVQIFQQCAASGLGLWMLIAGIGLTRRRSWSRAHLIGWSVGKILLVLVGMLVTVLFVGEMVEQFNAQLEQANVQFRVTTAMVVGLVAITQVWFLIWPVFLLIWFGRGSVKDEVAAWATESRARI